MAWNAALPANDSLLINTPGYLRANWDAIALGTDAALLITNAKCASDMALADSKLAQITTAAKVSGTALTLLPNIPAGAGVIPAANLPVGTTANKIVQLDASAKLPALDASQLTGLLAAQIPNLAASIITSGVLAVARLGTGTPDGAKYLRDDGVWTAVATVSQVSDTDAGTSFNYNETTFLSVTKTITAGHTVLLIATGYTALVGEVIVWKLKQGSTLVQAVSSGGHGATNFALSGIVTGLSGSVTFSVTVTSTGGNGTAYGNLEVLEF